MVSNKEAIHAARVAYEKGFTKTNKFREQQLNALLQLYKDNRARIEKSMALDLKDHHAKNPKLELDLVIQDLKCLISNFKTWSKNEILTDSLSLGIRTTITLLKQPHGVVLIIAPWNQPFFLGLIPLAGAIAAGNCVIIRLSYLSASFSELISEALPNYLHNDCYRVLIGGSPLTEELAKEDFDYIFFSGPKTLETLILDEADSRKIPVNTSVIGKCPVFLDGTTDIQYAIKSVLYGKFLSETYDYIICTEDIFSRVVKTIQNEIKMLWTKGIKFKGMVYSEGHFWRLRLILNSENEKVIGGKTSFRRKTIEPTVLINVLITNPLMKEECFGPILPLITVRNVDEAIEILQEWEEPQSLHVFSDDKDLARRILNNVRHVNAFVNNIACPRKVPEDNVLTQYDYEKYFQLFTKRRRIILRNYTQLMELLCFGKYRFLKLALLNWSRSLNILVILQCLGLISVGIFVAFLGRYSLKKEPNKELLVEFISDASSLQ